MEKRKILAVAVVALGAVGALLVLGETSNGAKDPSISIRGGNAETDRFQYPGFDATQKTGGVSSGNTANFTNQLAEQYISGFVNKNPDGPQMMNGAKGLKTPSISDQLADPELISKVTSDLQPKLFETKDIRTFSDSSVGAAVTYFSSITALEKKDFQKTARIEIAEALDAWVLNQNTKPSDELVAAMQRHIEHLIGVRVPSGLAAFHVGLLNTWARLASLFAGLTELNTDPLKAIVAFQMIPPAVDDFLAAERAIGEKTSY